MTRILPSCAPLTSPSNLPADADIDIFAWDGSSYQRIDGALTPGVGYWVMSSRAAVLPLR